jgi:hypothetical protein
MSSLQTHELSQEEAEQRRQRSRRGLEEEEERERSEGLVWKFHKVQGSLGKLKILNDIEIK